MITRHRIRHLQKKLEHCYGGAIWLEDPTEEEIEAARRKKPRAIFVEIGYSEDTEPEPCEDTARKSRRP